MSSRPRLPREAWACWWNNEPVQVVGLSSNGLVLLGPTADIGEWRCFEAIGWNHYLTGPAKELAEALIAEGRR